mmetsp:Transcript_12065/g.37212  ORF Transcript_12065/g.37212 Transcript_12065/m.37212 type:complete len:257 (+) Transcript_12065:233-1003(+)
MPSPSAVIRFFISWFLYIFSSSARSTLRILPRSGSTACVRRSRPCLVDPPAESPSTMKISVDSRSRSEQSDSLPGSVVDFSTVLRRTRSRARLAASAARAAAEALATIFSSAPLFTCAPRKRPSASETTASTARRASGLPSRVLVCPSNSGFGTRTLTTAVSPSRTCSLLRLPSFSLSLPAARAAALTVLATAALSASRCTPPSVVRMELAYPSSVSLYASPHHCSTAVTPMPSTSPEHTTGCSCSVSWSRVSHAM